MRSASTVKEHPEIDLIDELKKKKCSGHDGDKRWGPEQASPSPEYERELAYHSERSGLTASRLERIAWEANSALKVFFREYTGASFSNNRSPVAEIRRIQELIKEAEELMDLLSGYCQNLHSSLEMLSRSMRSSKMVNGRKPGRDGSPSGGQCGLRLAGEKKKEARRRRDGPDNALEELFLGVAFGAEGPLAFSGLSPYIAQNGIDF